MLITNNPWQGPQYGKQHIQDLFSTAFLTASTSPFITKIEIYIALSVMFAKKTSLLHCLIPIYWGISKYLTAVYASSLLRPITQSRKKKAQVLPEEILSSDCKVQHLSARFIFTTFYSALLKVIHAEKIHITNGKTPFNFIPHHISLTSSLLYIFQIHYLQFFYPISLNGNLLQMSLQWLELLLSYINRYLTLRLLMSYTWSAYSWCF
jgi:hypothetical protein